MERLSLFIEELSVSEYITWYMMKVPCIPELLYKLHSNYNHSYTTFLLLLTSHHLLFRSLEDQIRGSIQELGSLLAKVKGAGQVSLSQPSQRNNIQQESDLILRPLMDLLDGRFVLYIPLLTLYFISLSILYVCSYIKVFFL